MGKKFVVKVRGEVFEVEVEEVAGGQESPMNVAATAAAVQTPKVVTAPNIPVTPQPKAEAAAIAGAEQIIAPMPGTILRVEVKVGDSVNAGDVVAILEAMKLENELEASVSGVVKQVLVNSGTAVNEGDVIVVIG